VHNLAHNLNAAVQTRAQPQAIHRAYTDDSPALIGRQHPDTRWTLQQHPGVPNLHRPYYFYFSISLDFP
jgi:hypothetical protein